MKNLATNKETWLYLIKHIFIAIFIATTISVVYTTLMVTEATSLVTFAENQIVLSEMSSMFTFFNYVLYFIISICCFIYFSTYITQKILARKYTKEKMWDNLRRLAYEDMVNW